MNVLHQYNFMRVVSMFAVVLLHTAAPLLYLYNTLPPSDWHFANFYDSISRWCVPVFFMLSGAFLLDNSKSESLQTFLKKRLLKILIPLIFWSFIYYIFIHIILPDGKFTLESIFIFLKKLLNNEIYYHLWFLYSLLGIYLIVPFLRILVKNLPKSLTIYFLILWVIAYPIFNGLKYFFDLNIGISLPFSNFVGYFILGYYLRKATLNHRISITIYILAFISLIVTLLGTYKATSLNSGEFVGFYYDYLSLNTVIVSIAIFLLFKSLTINDSYKKIVDSFSDLSFGIYLIHALILTLLGHYLKFDAFMFNPLFSIPLVAIITTLISGIITIIFKKNKFLNYLIP